MKESVTKLPSQQPAKMSFDSKPMVNAPQSGLQEINRATPLKVQDKHSDIAMSGYGASLDQSSEIKLSNKSRIGNTLPKK